MNYFKEILLLFILTVAVNLSDAQVLVDTMKQDEICVHECKNTVFPLPNKKVDPQDLRKEYDLNNSNSSLDDCNASCKESYNLNQNLFACIIGCTTMARRSGMTAHFRIDIRVEDGVNPNMILGSPDSDKSEILHSQLPGWWDTVDEEIELPQSPLKYIQYVDYGNPLDNIKEAEKITVGSSDWLQCASKHIGVPKWMLAFAIVCTILAAVWFYLAQERSSNSIDKTPLIDSNLTNSKMMVYLPEEVLTHKKPPPKYSDVVDTNDLALKV